MRITPGSCFLFCCLVLGCLSDGDHHGPFGKFHSSLDIPSPFNCNRSLGLVSNSLVLNVSSSSYSNGDLLTVNWKAVSSPCPDDFLGIFFLEVPLDSGQCLFREMVARVFRCSVLGARDYLDFEFVREGMTNVSWTMLNLRRQLQFRFYRREENCTGNYSLLGQSSMVEPVNFNEPTQIHLAFADQLSEMFVSYTSNSNASLPQCQYGLSVDSLSLHADGESESYVASDMCEGQANLVGPQSYIHPGYLHTILLRDLRPSTIYFYQVGTAEQGWSNIYQFLTRPPWNDESEVNLIAYGDMGVSPIQSGARATIDRVLLRAQAKNVTAILHIGDLSYARGIGALWESYMDQIEPTSARFPYMVGIGNHEYDHVTGGDKDPSKAPGPGGFRPIWFANHRSTQTEGEWFFFLLGGIMERIPGGNAPCRRFVVFIRLRMATVFSGTVSKLGPFTSFIIRRNMIFVVHPSSTVGWRMIFARSIATEHLG